MLATSAGAEKLAIISPDRALPRPASGGRAAGSTSLPSTDSNSLSLLCPSSYSLLPLNSHTARLPPQSLPLVSQSPSAARRPPLTQNVLNNPERSHKCLIYLATIPSTDVY
ncbi:hypothetical protein E2C01_101149 [Portunus trituberculatus]|uniref:Uncharacterized protein n=1 Tax=Portunus trituberculatus TaxID=210409 RepID=A0A5B7KJS1_PORTR|nr:hypothetical protein [Portunus trituberculatus]